MELNEDNAVTEPRTFYTCEFYRSADDVPDDLTRAAEIVFERAAKHHGVVLGPPSRDAEKEVVQMRLHKDKNPGSEFTICRVHRAECLT